MARKPKAASSNEPAIPVGDPLPALSDAAAPVRRGRKPKAEVLPEPLAVMDSDDAAGSTVDADGTIADPIAAPIRKRPGPKPKPRAGAIEAAPLQEDAEAKPGWTARVPDATPELMPAANDAPHVEPATLETVPSLTASEVASPGPGQNAATAAQPAAHWDRATDTVRFEWAAIEQTAAQDGPNQAMAKLLVAARAEGANSRWPL